MSVPSQVQSSGPHPNVLTGILMRFGEIAIGFVLLVLILFLAAGRLDWEWGWIFLGIYLVSIAINSIFLLRTNPETVAERGQPGAMKEWDKVLAGLWSLAQFVALPLVAALDVRLAWTGELSAGVHWVGALIFAAGLGLFGWAMITNAYFSTAARIQSDRGQTVCRSGPYRFVRHPGYVGTILQSLGIPLLLGSVWAFLPGLAAAVFIIVRTAFEDNMLQAELPGYPDYTNQVRYRLVPGIW